MRQRISYLLLSGILLLSMSLSKGAADSLRFFTVACLTPVWRCGEGVRQYLLDRPIGKSRGGGLAKNCSLENQQLFAQQEFAAEVAFAEERCAEVFKGLKRQFQGVPARVIYRDPSSWSSSLWVEIDGDVNVEKSCPVIVGGALIGLVDYVGKRQARVRLITDSGVVPAVRALRGGAQERYLALQMQSLEEALQLYTGVVEEEKAALLAGLKKVRERLHGEGEDLCLAKGELWGSSASLWRSRRLILKGKGFNLDYPDEAAPKREVKPLIKEGDLLITSGLDGLFPPGLLVGVVTSVEALREGGYAYEIEARPACCDVHDFRLVSILPALSGE